MTTIFSDEELKERIAALTPEGRKAFMEIQGSITADDQAIALVLSNMAVDACAGNKESAKAYLADISRREPAVQRLMSRIAYQRVMG